MKKRSIPILMSLALLFGLFSPLGLSVNAVEPVPEVYVAGTLLTPGQTISDGVDGSLTLSADGKALTLDKFDVNHTAAPVNGNHASDSYIMINPKGGQGGGNFTIMVAGSNDITTTSTSGITMEKGNLTITSSSIDDILNCTIGAGGQGGLICNGDLTLSNISATFTGGSSYNISVKGKTTIDNMRTLTLNPSDTAGYALTSVAGIKATHPRLGGAITANCGKATNVAVFSAGDIYFENIYFTVNGHAQGTPSAIGIMSNSSIYAGHITLNNLPVGLACPVYNVKGGIFTFENSAGNEGFAIFSNTISLKSAFDEINTTNGSIGKLDNRKPFTLNGFIVNSDVHRNEEKGGLCYTDPDTGLEKYSMNTAIQGYSSVILPTAKSYNISITDGTASGPSQAVGSLVHITSNTPPNGKKFKEWTITPEGGTVFAYDTGKTSPDAYFVMPDYAVTIAATYEDLPVAMTFKSATPDGSDDKTTTEITLIFDMHLPNSPDLSAGDITLTDTDGTGITKGNLNKISSTIGAYKLLVSGITKSGTVKVTVNKTGYTFSPDNKDVEVFMKKPADVSSIETAITKANKAKENVYQIDNVDPSAVENGKVFASTAAFTDLNTAITTATSAKTTVDTTAQAQLAASALNDAVATFNSLKKTGTKPGATPTPAPNPVPPTEDRTYETAVYWDGVLKALKKAPSGTIIDTDPKYLDNMPTEIMTYLLNTDKSITLRLHYKGETFNINSNQAVTPEATRKTYTLQELLINYRGKKANATSEVPEQPESTPSPSPSPSPVASPSPSPSPSIAPSPSPEAKPAEASKGIPAWGYALGTVIIAGAALFIVKRKR